MGTIKRKNIFIEEFGVDGEDPKKKSAPNTKPNTVTQEPKKTGNIFVDEFGVKKKEASEVTSEPSPTTAKVSSPLAYQLPSETEAKETIFDKSFLDRDIQINAVDFLSNPNYKPSKELNLSSAYQQARQQRYDQKKRMTELDIKSSPEGLAAYTKKRVAELNSDIENAKDNLKGIFKGQGYGAKVPTEIRWQYEKDLADKVSYKNNLKSAVAAEVIQKVLPAYLEDGRPFNPRQMSRDIIKVADPEQEFIFQKAEENGAGLPGITNAILERTGIDLSKEYLRNLPQDEFTQRKLSEIEALESDFDERNFELTAQRVKEKLGVYFYNHADDPITGGKSGFWGYSAKNIESAINDPESGLTPSEKKIALEYVLPTEKKLFFSTDIPGSGFFRAGKNAIERSVLGVGNTISGWLGQRDDADRAYDLLNNEVEESRFRAPGENPTLKSELRHLENKEKKEGLSDIEKAKKVELEKFVDVRNGFSKFKDGVGDLTGQVLQIALLTRGVGMVGKGLTAVGEGGGVFGGLTTSALGNALSNETVGLFLTSYLNSYDNYKQQSLQLMPGVENAANRDAYAKVMAGIEGLSERIFVDTKVLKAFTKSASPTIADITNRFINKEITQQVARQELNTALQKYMKPFAKEFAKSTVQESTEEAVVDLADGISQSIFGGQPFDVVKTGQQALNTFLTTALHSPLVAGMAAHGKARQEKSQNAFMKSAIVDMANNPAAYLKSVEDLKLSGQITQDEANEKIQLINSASKYLKEIPENITVATTKNKNVDTKKLDDQWKQNIVDIGNRTDIDEAEKERLKQEEDSRHAKEIADLQQQSITDKQLDYPESATYIIHRLNEGILKDKIENLNDDALKPSLEAELKRSIEIRKGIIDGSIGVTPNIEAVTDNSNKAQELGVLDANQVSADDLIGTPFEKSDTDDLTPDQTKAVILAAKEGLPGVYGEIDPLDAIKEISYQAQGLTKDADGNVVDIEGGGRVEDLKRMGVSDAVIEAAIKAFPRPVQDGGISQPIELDPNLPEGSFPNPQKPISEMTADEIVDYSNTVKDYMNNQEVRFFGEEGAKRYKKALSITNRANAHETEYKEAQKIVNEMEDSLTDKQRNEFFGIGEDSAYVYDRDELMQIARTVRLMEESENISDLSRALKHPLLDFRRNPNNEGNMAVINAAKRRAEELGIDPKELIEKAVKNVVSELSDPEDAAFLAKNIIEMLMNPVSTTERSNVNIPELPKPSNEALIQERTDKENVIELSESEFLKKYKGQHKDLRGEGSEENFRKMQQEGFVGGVGPNAMPIQTGGGTDIISKRYGNKKGDIIYLVPKEYIANTNNGLKVKNGYKPSVEERVEIEYDGQPTYEAYINTVKKISEKSTKESTSDQNISNETIKESTEGNERITPKEEVVTETTTDTTGKKTSSAEIFDAITEAEKSKVRRKDKLSAVEKSVSEFGDEGKKAFEIHKNFESIVKQLQKSNKLEVKC